MKRILTAFALIFCTTNTVNAAGPYDGIYALNFSGFLAGYASIHENNGVIIAVVLEPSPSDSTWEAIAGTRNGNIVRLNSIFGTVNLVIDVTFNGDNATGTAVIIACSDDDDDSSNDSENCDIPAGTALNLTKIF